MPEPAPAPPHPVLDGLRVIELSAFVAAPLCGLALAQLGADVIRIDPPGGNLDVGRLPLAPSGASLYWASLNRGKRSVEIDFRSAAGQRLVGDLLAASGPRGGILVTNLGLTGSLAYTALRERRPDAIVVQLNGSPDGARELDYTVNCAVGFPLMTGRPGSGPVNHVLPAWDIAAGLTLANAVLAAELHRRETGEGQLVSLSLSDVAMAAASNLGYIADAAVNGSTRGQDGNYLYGAYGDVFQTADGRHVIAVAISDGQWRALVKTVGVEAPLAAAAQGLGYDLGSEEGRYAARELISAFLRPWFARRPLAEVQAALKSGKVLAGVYRTVPQMLAEDPRAGPANPMFEWVEHAGIGAFPVARSAVDFSAAPRLPAAAAPTLGAQTGAVLADLLGLAPEAIAQLEAAGTIGRRAAP